MRAFAILDGGGVKGAALAGCLSAAENRGVTFVGYGGTSAGSIVAVLGSVGYSGREIGDILVSKPLAELLDDGGVRLRTIRAEIVELAALWRSGKVGKGRALWRGWGLRKVLGDQHGLYPGDELVKFVRDLIVAKKPNLADHADITFADLREQGAAPLKIVASDLHRKRPAVFSADKSDFSKYGASVLDAVRASVAFPFVFRPHRIHHAHLVDGGLSSNLPSFLFANEYRQERVPSFAFDLEMQEPGPKAPYELLDYVKDLAGISLDASDHLLRGYTPGVQHVVVQLDGSVGTLDFDASVQQLRSLFDAGVSATDKFFGNSDVLKALKSSAQSLRQQLQLRHGPPIVFTTVLQALAREVSTSMQVENVRAHVMLPTGRGTRLVVYGSNPTPGPDADLELEEDAGGSGSAWSARSVALTDLTEVAKNPSKWKLTPEDQAKIPKTQKTMISLPIFGGDGAPFEQVGPTTAPVIGTLSVDTSTRAKDTGWADTNAGRVARIIVRWQYVLSRMLG